VGSNPAVAALWDGWGLRDLAWGPPCAAAGGWTGLAPKVPGSVPDVWEHDMETLEFLCSDHEGHASMRI